MVLCSGGVPMLLALMGCGPVLPLPEVPIVGASDELEVDLRAELLRFDAAIGPDRVTLRKVRVGNTGGEIEIDGESYIKGGIYHAATEVIELDVRIGDDELIGILRHELCHALDHQEGEPSQEIHEALVALGGVAALDGVDRYDREDPLRRETFAGLCELGPEVSDLLSRPCPSLDAVEITDVAGWMRETVWSGWEGWRWAPAEPSPTMEATFPTASGAGGVPTALGLTGYGFEDGPGLMFLVVTTIDSVQSPEIDPYTGQVDFSAETSRGSAPVSSLEDTDFGLPLAVLGYTNRDAVAIATIAADYGLLGTRFLVQHESSGWGPWSACPSTLAWDVTVLDSRVWLGWAAGPNQVAWTGGSDPQPPALR
jgi:hypothetical protein